MRTYLQHFANNHISNVSLVSEKSDMEKGRGGLVLYNEQIL